MPVTAPTDIVDRHVTNGRPVLQSSERALAEVRALLPLLECRPCYAD